MARHDDPGEGASSVERLRALLRDFTFCMFVTRTESGLRSRPMTTQQLEFDGALWFLTTRDADLCGEIAARKRVNLAYGDARDQRWISVQGRAQLVEDPAKLDELWHPAYRAWFPNGKDDPSIVLVRVDVDEAEYWDSPGSKVTHMVGFVKAMVTRQRADIGEHDTLHI